MLAIALVAFPVCILFLFARQLVLYLWYQHKARAWGVGAPVFVEYQWLCLPAIYAALKHARQNRLLTFIFKQHVVHKTTAINGISGLNFFTVDPANIKAVLSTQFDDFDLGDRANQLSCLLGEHGVFTQDGPGWVQTRALLRPQFSKQKIMNQMDSMERYFAKLLRVFRTKSATEAVFDVQEIFQLYTTELTLQFTFGEDVDCLQRGGGGDDEFQAAFDAAQEFLMFRAVVRSQFGQAYRVLDSTQFRRNCRICHEYIDRLVGRSMAREKTKNQRVFIDDLLEQTQDRKLLRDQCTSVMLAGRDTTACLLSFSCYLLARHKHIQTKLRRTVLDTFGRDHDTLNFDSLRQCEYLRWFFNEVLRMFAVVPLNYRQATRDTTLPRGDKQTNGPIFMPKGAQIFICSWPVHQFKDSWGEDAGVFNPERWARPSYPPDPWAFIPFSGGKRVCLGQQLALSEASYTLVRLLQEFDDIFTTVEELGTEFDERIGFVLRGARGVHCGFSSSCP